MSMAAERLAEEQAGVRQFRNTVVQNFDGRDILEKNVQHQLDLIYNFINFKKAFEKVWLAGL